MSVNTQGTLNICYQKGQGSKISSLSSTVQYGGLKFVTLLLLLRGGTAIVRLLLDALYFIAVRIGGWYSATLS